MVRRAIFRHSLLAAIALAAGASYTFAQGQLGAPVTVDSESQDLPSPTAPLLGSATSLAVDLTSPSQFRSADWGDRPASGFLKGNLDFPNFIGFISNPVQSIDPRSTTEIVAMFGSGWISPNDVTLPGGKMIDRGLLPSGNMQVYGGGPMAIALTDRFCFGLNDGGYAVADFSSDRQRVLQKFGLPVPNVDLGGQREGWLNLGGYFQYTVIADVPNQFLLTVGLRWEAPAGAEQIFQGGSNPAYLAPYVTAGKEFGNFHLLATTGYEFAAGSGTATTSTYYLNAHLDRQFGWFYPLIELNGAYHTNSVDVSVTTPRRGVIDLGTFESTGNTLTGAFGANAVLVPGKLEFGAVYLRPITAQNHFDFNGMLVKMTYRY